MVSNMTDSSSNATKKSKKKQKQLHVPNREAYDRINYLYQAAHIALARNPNNTELSRFYIATAKKITERLVLKIDPQVKKTICKCCHSLLVPGLSSKQRLRGKRQKHMVVTCLACKTRKRWRTNQEEVEKEQAIESNN